MKSRRYDVVLDFLKIQLDCAFFLQGLAWVLLAAVFASVKNEHKTQIPWVYIGVFSFAWGVHSWLWVPILGFGGSIWLQAAKALTCSISCLLIFGFGVYLLWKKHQNPRFSFYERIPWFSFYIIPLLCIAAAQPADWSGLEKPAVLALSIPGSILICIGLALELNKRKRSRRITAMVVTSALLLNATITLPVLCPRSIAAIILSGAMAFFSGSTLQAHILTARRRTGESVFTIPNFKLVILTVTILFSMVAAGFAVTRYAGNVGNAAMRDSLMMRADTAAASLPPDVVARYAQSKELTPNQDYRLIQEHIRRIRSVNRDCRYLYVVSVHKGNVVFLADAETEGTNNYLEPGFLYTEAPPIILDILKHPRNCTQGPYRDRWGLWVSGLVPIYSPQTGKPVAVLGMDYNAHELRSIIGSRRAQVLIALMILCVAVILLMFLMRRTEEFSAKIAASEARYRSLEYGSAAIITFFDLEWNMTSINSAGATGLGEKEEKLIGRNLWHLLRENDQGKIANALDTFYDSGRAAIEIDYTRRDGIKTSWNLILNPIADNHDIPTSYAGIWTDISDRKQSETNLRESERRLRKQQGVLVKLARSNNINNGNFDAAAREITVSVSKALGVARVSVWIYNDNREKIYCTDIWDERLGKHSGGAQLVASDYPVYFKALDKHRVITANRARTHLFTKEFKNGYLIPLDIYSMIDAPIRKGGVTIGVVCCESVGESRKWTTEEQGFVGSVADLVCLALEAKQRKHIEEALLIQTSAMNAASDQIVITDTRGLVEFVNPSFVTETGYALEEVHGKTLSVLKSGKHDKDFYDGIWETIGKGYTWSGEITNRRKNGELYVEDMTITPVTGENGKLEHFIAIKRNITDKKLYEQQLDYLAHHDPLTSLPNRLMFGGKLARALSRTRGENKMLAVMFLDIDGFKTINDTLGHNAGDSLLRQVADRLKLCMRDADTIARMGGDEFTAILTGIEHERAAVVAAKRVMRVITEPFMVEGHEIFISGSIGISFYPNDGNDAETLVKNADAAMYRAKEKGRNTYHIFTEAINAEVAERMALEINLRKAMTKDQLRLHYQPQIDIRTGRIIGVEALIRWAHPSFGMVPPAKFIPLAEETGIIVPIGEWVIKEACRQNMEWQQAGCPPVRIAVNVSPKQVEQADFISTVAGIITETGMDPRLLELEITETTIMRNPELVENVLNQLKEMDVRVSLDDFGTGYSSLSRLKRLPIDAVKIDRSFVSEITTSRDDAAIAGAVVAIAQSLGLTVIGEGVETLDQIVFLQSIGCHAVQGYFISHPVGAADLKEILMSTALPSAVENRKAA